MNPRQAMARWAADGIKRDGEMLEAQRLLEANGWRLGIEGGMGSLDAFDNGSKYETAHERGPRFEWCQEAERYVR